MSDSDNSLKTHNIDVGQGDDTRKIVIKSRKASHGDQSAGLMWLGGFRSDMEGGKAVAMDAHAAQYGYQATRHDYSGHGVSGGDFINGTISRWLEESLAVFDECTTGPQILVGSSMGGWIALRMVEELKKRSEPSRIKGLILLAPAPDFTRDLHKPKLSAQQEADLNAQGFYEVQTPYGPDPIIFTKKLFEDGEDNIVLKDTIAVNAPVHIIQGMQDPDVPWQHAMKLVDHLPMDNVMMTLVKDGDHRLSRPEDIKILLRAIETMQAQ